MEDDQKSSGPVTLALAGLLVVVVIGLLWGFFRPAESLAPPYQMHHGATTEAPAHAEGAEHK